jgi:hypothetical protein
MFLVKQELLQAIVNYLGKHPWSEVNPLMMELSKLRPVPPPEEPQ